MSAKMDAATVQKVAKLLKEALALLGESGDSYPSPGNGYAKPDGGRLTGSTTLTDTERKKSHMGCGADFYFSQRAGKEWAPGDIRRHYFGH